MNLPLSHSSSIPTLQHYHSPQPQPTESFKFREIADVIKHAPELSTQEVADMDMDWALCSLCKE